MGATTQNRVYTWSDYQSWNDGRRWEIIGGEVFDMSPAPNSNHQHLSRGLSREFFNFFKAKSCVPFAAPYDVKLSDEDIVQPDILVVCDKGKIKHSHLEGAPDLIVEIQSPWTARHDRVIKMALYARYGVKELWMATPEPPMVEVYTLCDGKYLLDRAYGDTGTLVSPLFEGFKIELPSVFDFEAVQEEKINRGLRFLKDPSDPYAQNPANLDSRTKDTF